MKKALVLLSATVLAAAVPASISHASTKVHAKTKLTAMMSGMKEPMGHGDKKGSGTFSVNIDPTAGKACFSFNVPRLTGSALAAHIHAGRAGVEGPVVVKLTPPSKNGRSVGCTKASASLLKGIASHPSSYYVNVHTAKYPGGAIRGQLGM